jgi:PAS domain S-box-containing protein
MPLPEPSLNILLINEQSDEIKLVTSSLRAFFTGCRIEAGYSSEEALTFSQRDQWHIILIDQDLSRESGLDILARIRRNAPYAAIILQTHHSDSETAVQALQSGADFLLFKNSPGFITELLFCVQEAIEKRDLQMKLDNTFQRHLRLVETLNDLLYELDQEGRFVYVSPTVTAMLGYRPEELAGRHYSILLPPLEEPAGRFRLNERRAGSRSVRRLELTLLRKAPSDGSATAVAVEVTAKGLYDHANRHIGTVGLLRDLSEQKKQQGRLAQLESTLRETDRQLILSREAARVSRQLQQPLNTLLADSQRLLSTIQHSKIEQHVETMVTKASQASRLSQQLAQVIQARPWGMEHLALNEILQTVMQSVQRETLGKNLLVTSQFADDLPKILGWRDAIEDLARILLTYAQRCTSSTAMHPRLTLHTEPLTVQDGVVNQGGRQVGLGTVHTYAAFTIRDAAEDTSPPTLELPDDSISPEEFLRAHRIVQAHGGAIEIENTADRGLMIRVRIPALADTGPSPFIREEREASAAMMSLSATGIHRAETPNTAAQAHDRRRSERRLFSLPVQLSIGNATLRGVLRNMSTGGALLTIRDLSPSVHLQPAYIVIKTAVSFLELHGVVHERPVEGTDIILPAIKDLAISFAINSEHDQNVLHSLLDGLQEGSTSVTFEGLILPPFEAEESRPADIVPSRGMPEDRRETIRLKVAFPIRFTGSMHETERLPGRILNLSRDGACIELSGHPDPIAVQEMMQLIPVGPINQPAGESSAEHPEQPWTARVIWIRRRINEDSRLLPMQAERLLLGVRFEHLSTAQELRLRSMMEPRISTSHDLAEPMSDALVLTVSYALRNREGYRIALCHDCPRQTQATNLPAVLLCPGYGTSQQAYVALAYFLAGCGLRVLRYDHSRHIGLSDGDPSQTTFTSLEDDLDTVLAFIQKEWPGASLTLLAPDLLGRIALRRQDWHRLIRRLLLLNPTLDVRDCLTTLHQRDLIHDHLTGIRFGTGNLLGLPLDIDRFLADAVGAQYADVSTLREDIAHCRTEVVILTAGPDTPESPIPAPSPPLLNETINLLGARSSRVSLPSTILTAGDVAPKALHVSWQRFLQLCHPPDTWPHPSSVTFPVILRSTTVRSRFERDQLRAKYAVGAAARERLWTAQTDLTPTLDELPTYWQYIDHLYQLSQPLDEGLALLEVGCGIHSFVRLLLLNLSYRLRAQTWHHTKPLRYVGIDFSTPALHAAQAATKDAVRHVNSLFSGRISTPTPVAQSWVLGRSMDALPFADHSFDRIIANLSLSFAPSPLHALRELFRVLRPGGKLIVSAFTPLADMALLYRAPLQELDIDEFTGEHRLTLDHMAQSCKALRTGQLHAFEEDTFSARLSQITALPAKLMRALAGHILLAVAEKPDSSG